MGRMCKIQSSQLSTSQVSFNWSLTFIGYGGYVKGVKSENVFGETYGKTSYASNSGSIQKGMDLPPHQKFQTSMKAEFTNMEVRRQTCETTAQIVGVDKGESCFKKAIPPSQTHAFFGADMPSSTNDEYTSNQKAQQDYRDMLKAKADEVKTQSGKDAMNAFYGIDPPVEAKEVPKFGEPIPGYSGVNRRVQADNVFGMTYAEARRMAQESMSKIDQEKSETLRETSKWVPEHQRKD